MLDPFAAPGLRSGDNPPLYHAMMFSQAMMRAYTERKFGTNTGEAVARLAWLAQRDPERFQRLDISAVSLLAQLANPQLTAPLETAITAYTESGYFHPDIHREVSNYYQKIGNTEKWLHWCHLLADSSGFEWQGAVRNTCTLLGDHYVARCEVAKGRSYLWRMALYSRYADPKTGNVERMIAKMKGKN